MLNLEKNPIGAQIALNLPFESFFKGVEIVFVRICYANKLLLKILHTCMFVLLSVQDTFLLLKDTEINSNW